MNNELAKRLIERKFNRDVDMNPEALSLDQIKALELTSENWTLLADIESAKRKPRRDVLEYAGEQAMKAPKEADLEKEEEKGEPVDIVADTPDPTETGQLEPGKKNLEVPEEVLHPERREAEPKKGKK